LCRFPPLVTCPTTGGLDGTHSTTDNHPYCSVQQLLTTICHSKCSHYSYIPAKCRLKSFAKL
ncbi:MAG TPA: hypothetical protein PKA53_11360, partial [Sphingobacterium sp.]|nr:hypothetical protein [Sphingobacterium sp.]